MEIQTTPAEVAQDTQTTPAEVAQDTQTTPAEAAQDTQTTPAEAAQDTKIEYTKLETELKERLDKACEKLNELEKANAALKEEIKKTAMLGTGNAEGQQDGVGYMGALSALVRR